VSTGAAAGGRTGETTTGADAPDAALAGAAAGETRVKPGGGLRGAGGGAAHAATNNATQAAAHRTGRALVLKGLMRIGIVSGWAAL
jgi:hypothetical protein